MKNGSRSGDPLGNVLDLAIVEYGVNDGIFGVQSKWTEGLGANTAEEHVQGLKERTELFFNELLSLPSSPAVVNLEIGNPRGDFNPTLAHLEAAERTGVPVVSFRDLLSFPDDPRFESFSNKPIFESFAKKLAVNNSSSLSNPIQPRGWFRRSPAVAGRRLGGQVGNDPALHPDAAGFYIWELEEGRSFDEARNHLYLQDYGFTAHPGPGVHALIAQLFYYFLQVGIAASAAADPNCQRQPEALSSRAARLKAHIPCPKGHLSIFESQILFGRPQPPGLEIGSEWRLVEDRPHKFGWVSEDTSSQLGQTEKTMSFNITLGDSPRVVVGYMHSYEKVGKLRVSMDQPHVHTSLKTRRLEARNEAKRLLPTTSLVIDAFHPESRFALETEEDIFPEGFQKGWALLHLTSVALTVSEVAERKGAKFKVTRVFSC